MIIITRSIFKTINKYNTAVTMISAFDKYIYNVILNFTGNLKVMIHYLCRQPTQGTVCERKDKTSLCVTINDTASSSTLRFSYLCKYIKRKIQNYCFYCIWDHKNTW